MKTWKTVWMLAAGVAALAISCSSDDDTSKTTGGVGSCDPQCDATQCMVCDISGETPSCKSACAPGLSCVAGVCEAPTLTVCDPACSPCEVCDSSGPKPECKSVCAAGLACKSGVCQAPEAPSCEPACGACEVCDTTGAAPTCQSLCSAGTSCVSGMCQGPGAPSCNPACGPCEVCDTSGTAPVCVGTCGKDELCAGDKCIRKGLHAGLAALQGPFADGPAVTAQCLGCHQTEANHFKDTAHFKWAGATPNVSGHESATTFGKKSFINNFCIAVVSNEKRCTQCHAGYGWSGTSYDFSKAGNIDCLVCHADPGSGYSKDPKNAGLPLTTVDLAVAARSVGRTTRQNCGSCHFYAGGGDNVKLGDLGSALGNPSVDVDVHLGRGFTCSNCHQGANHTLLGTGANVPVVEGSVACEDCHGSSPHTNTVLNEHALDVACETCHVPAFSRTQPTKMDWDWSTAGNKTKGTDGIETTTLPDNTKVTSYDYMKGNFVWQKNVRPEYAWYDGRVSRMVVGESYTASQGASASDPVVLGKPLATKNDAAAKIYPFKVMRGRQPGHVSGYLIVPKLFGPGGFWGGIPAATDYTEAKVKALWNSSLTAGALAAGQLAAGQSYVESDWKWVYTEMYLNTHHEVAPKAQALGAGTTCTNCHGNAAFDFKALGYSCDPIGDPTGCGSRHK